MSINNDDDKIFQVHEQIRMIEDKADEFRLIRKEYEHALNDFSNEVRQISYYNNEILGKRIEAGDTYAMNEFEEWQQLTRKVDRYVEDQIDAIENSNRMIQNYFEDQRINVKS